MSLMIQAERFSSVDDRILCTFGMNYRTPHFVIQAWTRFQAFLSFHCERLSSATAMSDASIAFECNITSGNVRIDGDQVTCSTGTHNSTDMTMKITGTFASNAIQINSTDVTLHLSAVHLNQSSPFVLSRSSVALLAADANTIASTLSSSPRIDCSFSSNLAIPSIDAGKLTAIGGTSSAGIGPGTVSSCRSISILNGSIEAAGGTRIGIELANSFNSRLATLLIQHAVVLAKGKSTGIGTGSTWNELVIQNLMICNADVSAEMSSEGLHDGSGIGTGSVNSGTSGIETLMIWTSNITANAALDVSESDTNSYNSGSGLGTGSVAWGTSKIGTVMIWNANITAGASSGASGSGMYSRNSGSGIRTARLSACKSMIETVMIWNANITAGA
jgi:hypothetical protein